MPAPVIWKLPLWTISDSAMLSASRHEEERQRRCRTQAKAAARRVTGAVVVLLSSSHGKATLRATSCAWGAQVGPMRIAAVGAWARASRRAVARSPGPVLVLARTRELKISADTPLGESKRGWESALARAVARTRRGAKAVLPRDHHDGRRADDAERLADGDEQVRRQPPVETRVDACAGMSGRYARVIVSVREGEPDTGGLRWPRLLLMARAAARDAAVKLMPAARARHGADAVSAGTAHSLLHAIPIVRQGPQVGGTHALVSSAMLAERTLSG